MKNDKKILLFFILLFAVVTFSSYAINIAPGGTVTETFTIGTSATAALPTGWKADKNTTVRSVGTYSAAVSATEFSAGNNMSSTATSGIYNYAAGDPATETDRAVGGISSRSASKSVNLYVQLTNNGTAAIPNFTISYNVEKYRNGTNSAGFTIQMYYSTDGSTWTSAGDNFKTSFAGGDANNNGYTPAPGATSSVSNQTLSQSLAAGNSIYLAWNYSVTSGSTTSNAQALGVDDVSITAGTQGTPTIQVNPSSLSDFSYIYGSGPSSEKSFSLTGTNLTGTLNVSAPTDYEIASSSGGTFGSSLSYTPSGGSVSATVYVRLKAGLASGSYNNENISCSSSGATTQNVTCSGTVYKPEPSNHVTNFTCGTTTISTIPLSWTDAAKTAPDGYLIKGSNVGFSSITAPVDGTPEPDAALVKNVAQGSKGSCTFTNLSSNTTYYFKIYPYTNSENAINYKTDGTVPQASATTQKEPDLIHYWNFNTNPPTSPANWPQPLTADIGTGSLSYNLTEATSFGGSTLNGVESEVAGGSFVPVNQSNNGNYFTLAVPTNGYSNIIISYATRGTATGFSSQAIYYSTDGVNFNLMTTFTGTNVTDWSVKNIDFSSIPAVNNNQNFMIRIVVSGATSASGNNRFDNIKILGNENPLPVELTSFTADFTQSTTGDMYVSIKWTTQSETALAGYYLYRGTTNDLSAAEQITLLIVPANSSHGASYEFIDREIQSGTTYYYWLQSMEMDGSSDFHGPVSVTVNEGGNITPPAIITETRLLNAYPNPFNPTTTLCYTLKERGQVKIEIYNVRGQLIRSFMPAPQDKGYYQIIWDGKDLNGTQASSGAYYVRMTCGKYVSSQRIVLMK